MVSKALIIVIVAVVISSIPVVSADGYINFRIRGGSVQDPYVFIVNDISDIPNFSYMPDHSDFDTITAYENATVIKVLPNGESDLIHMWDGDYIAYIRQGNADQPEVQPFVVGGQGITYVSFLGAAIPTDSMGCCACHNITVIDKKETVIHHPEVNHTEHSDIGIPGYIVVIDRPAYDEEIYHPEVSKTVCYPEINYTQKQSYYYTKSNGWEITTPWKTMRCPAWETIFPRRCEERVVVESEAYCEVIVDQQEYTETIHHPEVSHIETITHTEEYDTIVVDKPAWDEQVGAVTHEERVCGQRLVCPCGCVKREAVHG